MNEQQGPMQETENLGPGLETGVRRWGVDRRPQHVRGRRPAASCRRPVSRGDSHQDLPEPPRSGGVGPRLLRAVRRCFRGPRHGQAAGESGSRAGHPAFAAFAAFAAFDEAALTG